MNYYERHLGDYARDTAHLSMLEHGAYGLLLDRYYATEQGIPDGQAHRLARARTREEKAAVDAVLAEFFQLVDGVWVNSRAEGEIEKTYRKIDVARKNGKSGGRPKKDAPPDKNETQEKPSGLLPGSENETQQKALQSPGSTLQLNTEYRVGVYSETAKPPPIPADFLEVIKTGRPELNADVVFAVFAEHYPPDRQTMARWQKWVATEHAPLPDNTPEADAKDPDSRAMVEAEGMAKGLGRWDELAERWPAYRARVRGVQAQAVAVSA